MQVLVRDNNVDQALRALKKKMQREGIFREMKLRGHYEKPSEKKAREKAEAVRRARKLIRKKLQREGLLPSKPRPAPRVGGPGAPRPAAPAPRQRLDTINSVPSAPRGRRFAFWALVPCKRHIPMVDGDDSQGLKGRWGMGEFTMIGRMARLSPGILGILATLVLAGCEMTVGSLGRAPGVAVVEEESKEASGANIGSLTEVIQRNPQDPAAFNTRGAAYARLARYPDAIADFNKAVQIDPNYAPAYANRALAFRQTNRNDAALADFSRAISADPSYAPAYVGRANLLRVQGNYAGALEDLSQAIRLNPEDAQAFHARGLVHQRQGDHKAAVLDFDAAIDRNPFAGAPYAARGQSLVAVGQYDKAIEDLNATLNTDHRNADAWAWRGLAFEKQGNRKDAIESYQRATTVESGHKLAREGLARVQGGLASVFR